MEQEKTKSNKIIIGVLLVAAIVFGFMWYNQNLELAQLKTSKNEDEEMNAAFDQISEDIKTVDVWQKLQCAPKNRLDCVGTNCTQSQPIVYLILDRPNKTYSRCDSGGCDTHDANFASGGIYTNIQALIPNGGLIKILGNREYIEMATFGLSSVFQSGSCSEIR